MTNWDWQGLTTALAIAGAMALVILMFVTLLT
jgi:hypothetical protein